MIDDIALEDIMQRIIQGIQIFEGSTQESEDSQMVEDVRLLKTFQIKIAARVRSRDSSIDVKK